MNESAVSQEVCVHVIEPTQYEELAYDIVLDYSIMTGSAGRLLYRLINLLFENHCLNVS